jgi:G6PDH family F420-dependent oxidoreductase
MLEEAVAVIRELWGGGLVDHHGRYYQVVDAQLFTLPDEPPPIYVAASGTKSAETAARSGDGLIGTSPDREMLDAFSRAGGVDKPRLAQLTVCWADDEPAARATALRWWPTAAVKGELGQELPLPRHFEQAAAMVGEDDVARAVVCGPDAGRHVDAVREMVDAGYDHVFVHQVGPEQEGGLRFYAEEVLPRLRQAPARKAG